MKSALVIGNGQIGSEIAAQLSTVGVSVRIATRSGPRTPAQVGVSTAVSASSLTQSAASAPVHIKADASDRAQLARAAEGVDAIFACAHAAYDSRVWERLLPSLDSAVLDTAAQLDIPVVFPESVYAFAGLGDPITETSPFAPVEDKGRIRQRLLDARASHTATSASVVAGDLLGRTAETATSVVRMCITRGRRAFVPARTDVAHGITVIADLAAAMIRAAELLTDVPAGTHAIHIAPSSNPTLAEIAVFTHSELGSRQKRPLALPRWSVRAAGLVERSMYELAQLAPIPPASSRRASWLTRSARGPGKKV